MSGGFLARGVFGKRGFCPGGFCPGVYVRGVFVQGVFVLEPIIHNLAVVSLQGLTASIPCKFQVIGLPPNFSQNGVSTPLNRLRFHHD